MPVTQPPHASADKATSSPGAVYVQTASPGDYAAINSAVRTLLNGLPAISRLTPDSRVLLKPNLLSANRPSAATTTHPDVLRAVILALQARGVQHITVADSPGGPYRPTLMHNVYTACGIAQVCEETGAKLYTACESTEVPAAEVAGGIVNRFQLIRPVLESDFIINLPKMKTHVLTGMSGAVKNLFGCVPGLQKAEFHMRFAQREHFCRMLVALCETVQADIHLVDGIIAMEGDGPGSGTPRNCGLLLAGEDPYTVDLALCHCMGLPPMQMPVLAQANALGLCADKLDHALLQGSAEATQPVPDYVPPRSYTGRMNFASHAPSALLPVVDAFTNITAPKPVIRRKRCVGCGKCAEICPQQVIDMVPAKGAAAGKTAKAKINYKNCIRCFCCHEICPVHAVDVRRSSVFRL